MSICLIACFGHLTACQSHRIAAVAPEQTTSPAPENLYEDTKAVLRDAGFDPARVLCNNRVYWRPEVNAYAERAAREIAQAWSQTQKNGTLAPAAKIVRGYLVRAMFEQLGPNNLGVMRLDNRFYRWGDKRRPLLLFRSGVMTDAATPGSCLQSLMEQAQVRHVVNLYTPGFPVGDFVESEKRLTDEHGATFHDESHVDRPWRSLLESEESYETNLKLASAQVADLIRKQILMPTGNEPRGNILVHCAGGMHHTGMVYGIIQRCINHESEEAIENTYRRHVAYRSEKAPGAFEELNLRFIRDFDCGLLAP